MQPPCRGPTSVRPHICVLSAGRGCSTSLFTIFSSQSSLFNLYIYSIYEKMAPFTMPINHFSSAPGLLQCPFFSIQLSVPKMTGPTCFPYKPRVPNPFLAFTTIKKYGISGASQTTHQDSQTHFLQVPPPVSWPPTSDLVFFFYSSYTIHFSFLLYNKCYPHYFFIPGLNLQNCMHRVTAICIIL